VLIGVDDVEPGVGEEAADGGAQPGPIWTGEQQARCRLLGDPRIIACEARDRIKKDEVADRTSCLTSFQKARTM
jgi:hypothetical protein